MATPVEPTIRHASTPIDRQRSQIEKLLKDPAKPAFIPPPPKDKIIRPAREMMKNVQGSSAGAGSGEFHVYKASRRREYERLKMMEDLSQQETDQLEFEMKKREREETAEAKTAKNRAKRQKKKGKAKIAGKDAGEGGDRMDTDGPIKKRRLVNGKEMVFKKRDEGSEDEEDEPGPAAPAPKVEEPIPLLPDAKPAVETAKIVFHDED